MRIPNALYRFAAAPKMWLTSLALITTFLLVGVAGAQTANVQIIHNSPDPGASVVDVYVGKGTQDPAIDNFGYREATGLVELPAGVELEIGIAPGNSSSADDVIAWFTPTLAAGVDYVAMAAGLLNPSLAQNPDGIDTAFDLHYEVLQTSAPAGEVGLLAFHGAPDAPTVDVNAVGVGNLISGLAFTDFDGYLNAPAANYQLDVTPEGAPQTVVARFSAPLSGLGGGTAVVFASGFLSDPTKAGSFGLFAALNDGTVLPLEQVPVPAERVTWGNLKAAYSNE